MVNWLVICNSDVRWVNGIWFWVSVCSCFVGVMLGVLGMVGSRCRSSGRLSNVILVSSRNRLC